MSMFSELLERAHDYLSSLAALPPPRWEYKHLLMSVGTIAGRVAMVALVILAIYCGAIWLLVLAYGCYEGSMLLANIQAGESLGRGAPLVACSCWISSLARLR